VPATLVKKYGNRRLYDTGDSRYITLEELAAKVRGGTDVRVVDAQTGEELTQSTLAQIILESNSAKFLPVPLLNQLVRLGDDALAEFFGRYVSSALELYMQAKRGAQALTTMNPLAQFWMNNPFSGYGAPPPPPPPAYEPPPPSRDDDIAELRREVEELKRSGLGKPGAKRNSRKK
jgi:polyhydroxyalkanoate synthesis repressor PhaR